MSALGGGTSLTVAMAFLCIFLGVLVCFFYFAFKAKKAEFKDETEKFYPNFLHLFVAIFLCLCYILYDC